MSHHHPGYVYRLTGKITPDAKPTAITDWSRDRGEAERKLAACLADDRAEGIPTAGVYNIETISVDWLA